MVLGLVLHTCAAFSPSKYWLVSYIEPIKWVDYLNDFIHLFRMPLFFMISGFFAFIMMEKQSLKAFCSTKFVRIAVPFISVLLVINLPQYLGLDYLTKSNISNYINTNSLVGHLWFLVNLLVYFLLYSIIHRFFQLLKPMINKLSPITYISLVIVIVPIGYLGVLGANKVGIPIYDSFLLIGSIHTLFSYFDYFIIGALFSCLGHENFINTLKSTKGFGLMLVLLLVSILPLTFTSINNDVTIPYLNHIQAISVSLIFWLIATKLMNSNTGILKQLANASYSIYLFHHVIVVLIVLGVNILLLNYRFNIDSNLVFVCVILMTLLLTAFIHNNIVSNSNVMAFLFNGKSVKRL